MEPDGRITLDPSTQPPAATAVAPGAAEIGPRPRSGLRIVEPLALRDFRFLWVGMAISLLGDGIYLVALAWQVYEISNAPTALSAVSIAWSLPMIAFLLPAGALSDRFDRRAILVAADVVRAAAIGMMGVLSVWGNPTILHFVVLSAFYGIGQALYGPAFGAIVPDLVPQRLLVQANSLDNFVRPAGERLLGPAIGGFLVATIGAGGAFLANAATFLFSAAMIAFIRTRPSRTEVHEPMMRSLREGWRFVRAHPWLWATLASASLTLLCALGPFQVLLPFLIKNKLGGGAQDVGLVFAAGGVGAVVSAILMAQRSLPRKHILFMYSAWALGIFLLAPYAVITETWHGMVLEAVAWFAFTAGLIVWTTLMHTLVPAPLLGRVTSFDWVISIGLIPLSFALTGPLAEAIGMEKVFVGAGVLGAITTLGFLFVPGIRDTERADSTFSVESAASR